MQDEVIKKLNEAQSEQEWNAICDDVKCRTKSLPESERSGDYPQWWFIEVVGSGLAGRKARQFDCTYQPG